MIEGITGAERGSVADVLTLCERRFLEACPDFEKTLDADRARNHLVERLASARRSNEPVPHVVLTDFFEPAFYEVLETAWPPLDIFTGEAGSQKRDLVPSGLVPVVDSRNAGYESLPPALRKVWDFFVFIVNRQIVGPELARIFAPEISTRVDRLRTAYAAGLITYPMAGARDWSYRANVGRFMVRGQGYQLKPHLDSMPYLVTALNYFPFPGRDDDCGTIFYAPNRPLDFDTCVRNGSTQYFEKAGIDCVEVLRIPYRRNTLVAFPNTLAAAHGVVAPLNGYRRVFQYHISLKGDHEKV